MTAPEYITKIAQYPSEIDWLCRLFKDEGVKSYLEIGSRQGGSLWRIGHALPAGSRLVAVDMPSNPNTVPPLKDCVRELKNDGYDVHLIMGDSRDAAVVQKVLSLGLFDALLIDGDHRIDAVTSDWRNYGPMARIVAFHDIAWKRAPEWTGGYRIDVPQFWAGLKTGFKHQECIHDPTGKDNGLGVLWRN